MQAAIAHDSSKRAPEQNWHDGTDATLTTPPVHMHPAWTLPEYNAGSVPHLQQPHDEGQLLNLLNQPCFKPLT
jgi:hypothetical protein